MMKEKGINGLGTVKSLTNSSSLFSGFQFSQGAEMKGRFNMKKLMVMGAAALCGAVALADVTSANVVGYQNKPARNNFNYVTPSFRPVAGMTGADSNEMSINEIQLSADAGTACNLQILDDNGGMAKFYSWIPVSFKGSTAKKYKELIWPEENVNGIWAVSVGSGINAKFVNPGTVGTDAESYPTTVKVAQGIQIYANEGNTINFVGQVGEETIASMTRPTRNNFNYFGNPFAAAIPVDNIQMSADAGTACNLQILDDNGGMAKFYSWIPVSFKGSTAKKYKELVWPEGDVNGIWAVSVGSGINAKFVNPGTIGTDAETYPKTIEAGQCVQIYANEGNSIYILCPYDL